MATSNSVDFAVTRNDIINDAYSHIGHLDEGEILTGEREEYAARQLNKMIKAWTAKGTHLWALKERELPLAKGVNAYTIGPSGDYEINRPNRVANLRRKGSDGIETPVWHISRREFMEQPNKISRSTVNMAYYDRQLTNGVMYVWPTPSSGLECLLFTSEEHIEDFDASTNDTAFPQEWAEALSWNLAVRLGFRENIDPTTLNAVKGMADECLDDALNYDVDNVSLYFQPEYVG